MSGVTVEPCQSANEVDERIEYLVRKVPKVCSIFDVHRTVGQGSYGSVMLASLKTDSHLADDEKKLFAIKHLIPVSHPNRVEHELRCLKDIGGCDNIIKLDLCFRQNDAVIFVMPYVPHTKFCDYFYLMDAEEIKFYMKNLLIALNRVHQFNVIHRDVKPSNFLYDRINKKFSLVDFGLAQKVHSRKLCSRNKTDRNITVTKLIGKRKIDEINDMPESHNTANKNLKILGEGKINECSKQHIEENRQQMFIPFGKLEKEQRIPTVLTKKKTTDSKFFECSEKDCRCNGMARVCSICLNKQSYKAARSGTPGFRPPEVLLKYPYQTTAVDIWASGVIFLSLLSGCYPFFSGADDFTSLAELVTIFGSFSVKKLAHTLGRDFLCSEHRKSIDLKKMCIFLRLKNNGYREYTEKKNGKYENGDNSEKQCNKLEVQISCDNCALSLDYCICTSEKNDKSNRANQYGCFKDLPDEAFDLLTRLLDVNPHTRITAKASLRHRYFAE